MQSHPISPHIIIPSATPTPHLSNNMAAPALPSILLILSVAFAAATIAAAHRSPPSYETKLVKACTQALGPGGASLVTFCARDFLGHRAALLSGCGKRETMAVVLTESYKRAAAFEDFVQKITSDKSLSVKAGRDLKSCWGLMNSAVSSVGNIYANVAVKKLSIDAVLNAAYEKAAVAKGRCNFSAAGRRGGLWSELEVKAKDTLKAEIVALAFLNQFRPVLN